MNQPASHASAVLPSAMSPDSAASGAAMKFVRKAPTNTAHNMRLPNNHTAATAKPDGAQMIVERSW